MNVSEMIGEEYKNWGWGKECGKEIIIKAPTGSGKTYFVLHKLLKYMIEQGMNKKMLYVVNRKILKKQLEEELHNDIERELYPDYVKEPGDIDKYITIITYQQIEKALLENGTAQGINGWLSSYSICVYDECHYFFSDSNFNTYTELSFDALRDAMELKIQIFISATIGDLEVVLKNRIPHCKANDVQRLYSEIERKKQKKILKYGLEKNYSYIKMHAFENMNILKEAIVTDLKNNKEKWLIFTDSIEEGRKLEKQLQNTVEDDSKVVFIAADYMRHEDSKEVVDDIVEQKKANRQVVITTSVMDNGISFQDKALRKIVVMADTEEAFIQMVGRKREDGGTVQLYVLKREALHFSNRLKYVNRLLDFCRRNDADFNRMYSGVNIDKKERCYPYDFMVMNTIPNVYCQKGILEQILKEDNIDAFRKVLYTVNGFLAMNSFAYKRCMSLRNFYSDMCKEMETDDNAFVRVQAQWLGKREEEITHIIGEVEERNREELKKILDERIGEELDSEKNKELKMEIKEMLLSMLGIKGYDENLEEEMEKRISNLKKGKERALSKEDFDFFMTYLELPYRMNKPSRSTFIVEKVDREV